jgi:hypothetical protein
MKNGEWGLSLGSQAQLKMTDLVDVSVHPHVQDSRTIPFQNQPLAEWSGEILACPYRLHTSESLLSQVSHPSTALSTWRILVLSIIYLWW